MGIKYNAGIMTSAIADNLPIVLLDIREVLSIASLAVYPFMVSKGGKTIIILE